MRPEAEVRARLDELDKIGKKNGTLNRDELIEFAILHLRLAKLKKLGSGGGEG